MAGLLHPIRRLPTAIRVAVRVDRLWEVRDTIDHCHGDGRHGVRGGSCCDGHVKRIGVEFDHVGRVGDALHANPFPTQDTVRARGEARGQRDEEGLRDAGRGRRVQRAGRTEDKQPFEQVGERN